MRLIDADTLKRKAQKVATEAWKMKIIGSVETVLNQFIDWIDDSPTIEPEPPWIPCSDRLPEKSGQYYVSGGDKVWICEFLIIPNFTGGWCNDVANPMVQAWMPKPEPYREGEGCTI